MGYRLLIAAALSSFLVLPIPAQASTGDVAGIIEKFVVHEFPHSAAHYWVITETQWDGDEMVVDLHTIVMERQLSEPRLSRFLLLIVAGELKGVQNISLEPETECRPEKDT
jgi:hypothetical protein